MKKYVLIIFLILLSVFANKIFCQKTDSLLNLLSVKGADTNFVYYNIGNHYYDSGDYDRAMEFYLRSLRGFEKNKSRIKKSTVLNVIGNIYVFHQKEYEKGLEYYKEALKICTNSDDLFGVALEYNNIGIVYGNLNEYDLGLEYFLKSLNLKNEINDTVSIYITLNNIGELYCQKEEYEKAIEYFRESVSMSKGIDSWAYANTLNNISKYYLAINDLVKTEETLQESISISKKNSFKSLLQESYLIFSKLRARQNDIKSLEKYNQLYLSITDSLYNARNSTILMEMQTKYETREKEKENELLKAEKEIKDQKLKTQSYKITALLVGLMFILIFSAIFFLQLRKQRKVNKVLVSKNLEIVEREKDLQKTKEEVEIKFEKLRNSTGTISVQNIDKYAKSDLGNEQKQEIIKQIENFMATESPFLRSEFSLIEMAEKLDFNRSYISQVINEHYRCNFNSFINDYRIKEARKKLSDPSNTKITIEAIAHEVGFKSKTSFNNAFKKFTGVTPSFYLKSIIDNLSGD